MGERIFTNGQIERFLIMRGVTKTSRQGILDRAREVTGTGGRFGASKLADILNDEQLAKAFLEAYEEQ